MGRASPQNAAKWHELAVTRVRDLRARALFSILIAGAGVCVARTPWPAPWLIATLVAQCASLIITEPMRRDASFKVSRARELAFYVGLGLSAAIFAACGAFFWFDGGSGGPMFAMIVLAGGAVNVALQAQGSARLQWIGCTPFMLQLGVLPLISLGMAESSERGVMTLTAFGCVLMVLHLAAAGHRSVVSARKLQLALQDANSERLRAEAASAAKSDFLGVMSHELRTPLNGVLGMAQAMDGEALTPVLRERLEVIRRSGESLLMLLNDLLDLSKLDTARLELETELVDLELLAAQTEALFAPLAAAKALGFELSLTSSAGQARVGDVLRVRQVLHNLVGNAVKFTEAGQVAVRITGTADELVLEVADSGPGVEPEQLAGLFERFGLSDPSATRRHGGSGLGLAIARGLAQLMGGDVTARSDPGQGSVFTATLRLPLAGPQASSRRGPVAGLAETRSSAGRLQILAAEDNPTNRLVLTTLLETVEADVHVVGDGQAAVAAWRAGRWDLVLMDVQMPAMDGLAATRAIRLLEAAEGRPRTPIIAVTANAVAQQAAEYMAAGMDGLVPKPIQLRQLLGVIAEVLSADRTCEADARSAA
jgi:signal transduction histidine kinase/ActR/RegA family two-component response regulator